MAGWRNFGCWILAGAVLTVGLPAAAGAWSPVFPVTPFGAADPELLREAGAEPIVAMSFAAQIFDGEGRPVAGAEVLLRPVSQPGSCLWRDNRAQPLARTDREGLFRFDGLDPADWAEIDVSAFGYQPRTFELGRLVERTFAPRYRLEAAGAARLQVVDPAGRPIADAWVEQGKEGDLEWLAAELFREGEPEPLPGFDGDRHFAAGPDGRVLLRGVPPGARIFVVRAPHRRTALVTGARVAAGQESDLGKVVLEPAPRISGSLADAKGEAVADASLEIEPMLGDLPQPFVWGSREIVTDDEGRFDEEWDLPAGFPFVLTANEDDGFVRLELDGLPEKPVQLLLGEQLGLSGRVTQKADGEPLASCFLAAAGKAPALFFERTRSEEDGFFFFAAVPAGEVKLSFECGSLTKDLEIDSSRDEPILVELENSPPVVGKIATWQGLPLPNAQLFWQGEEVAVTNVEGRFRGETIPAGRRTLVVRFDSRRYPVEIEVPKGGTKDLEIKVPEEGYLPVAGRVLGADGWPASVTLVLLAGEEPLGFQPTSAEGNFSFGSLADGEYRIRLSYESQIHELPAFRPAELILPHEILLPAGTKVAGKLTGLHPGDAGKIYVAAWRQRFPPLPGYRYGPSAPGGVERVVARISRDTFEIEGLWPGEWTLRAGVLGRPGFTEVVVEVGEGAQSLEISLELPAFP